ncbi:MAG: hypothetical protein BWY76_00354 [bacterium ADurb.Bin429]|nr:MAG: hypothetical protein BWY76_00354 [bacterium ADurb.Bin429]
MRNILAVVVLCMLVLAPAFAAVQVTVYESQYGLSAPTGPAEPVADWSRGVLFVTADGRASSTVAGTRAPAAARQAAMVAARARLAMHLGAMKLTGFVTLGDALATRLLPAVSLEALCAPLRLVVERYNTSTRACTVTAVLPLTGPGSPSEVAAQMLTLLQGPKGKEMRPVYTAKQMTLKPSAPPNQVSSGPYSGLVLDCRGLGYTPVFTPRLIWQDGAEVWGVTGVNAVLVKEKGLAAYAPNLKVALLNGRAGNVPLLVRPLGTAGPLRGDLVLRAEDIKALQDEHAAETFLATLSLIILVD